MQDILEDIAARKLVKKDLSMLVFGYLTKRIHLQDFIQELHTLLYEEIKKISTDERRFIELEEFREKERQKKILQQE